MAVFQNSLGTAFQIHYTLTIIVLAYLKCRPYGTNPPLYIIYQTT